MPLPITQTTLVTIWSLIQILTMATLAPHNTDIMATATTVTTPKSRMIMVTLPTTLQMIHTITKSLTT
jgi:hypothetical protein